MTSIPHHQCCHLHKKCETKGTITILFKRYATKTNQCIHSPMPDDTTHVCFECLRNEREQVEKELSMQRMKYHDGYEEAVELVVPTPASYRELQALLAQKFPSFGGLAILETLDGTIVSYNDVIKGGDSLVYREITPESFDDAKKHCKALDCKWEQDVYTNPTASNEE